MIHSVKDWLLTYKPSSTRCKIEKLKKHKREMEEKLRKELEMYESNIRKGDTSDAG